MIANCQNFRIVVVNIKNNNNSVGLSVGSYWPIGLYFLANLHTFQVRTMMLGSLLIVSSLVVITGTKGEWVNSKAIWQTIWDESCPCEYHLKTNWIQGATLDECKARCIDIEKCNAIQFRSACKTRQVQRYQSLR